MTFEEWWGSFSVLTADSPSVVQAQVLAESRALARGAWNAGRAELLNEMTQELGDRMTVTFSGDGEYHEVPGVSVARLLMPQDGGRGLPCDPDLQCVRQVRNDP